jgi:hypothetical protein
MSNNPHQLIADKFDELISDLTGQPANMHYPLNYPDKIVVDKLAEFGIALKQYIDEHGSGIWGHIAGILSNQVDLQSILNYLEAYDQQQDQKIETLNGHYFPLEGYDFGKTLDVTNPDDIVILNTYAMAMESVGDISDIIDGTVIKNLFDGVEFVFNASNQEWVDWGIGNIVTASNEHLGVVEGIADPGDGTADGMGTVLPGGTFRTIGFEKTIKKDDVIDNLNSDDTDKPLSAAKGKNLNEIKAPISSPDFTGTPKVPSKTSVAVNDGTLIATEAQVYTVFTAIGDIAAALDLINGEIS